MLPGSFQIKLCSFQLLACVHDENITYASNNQDLIPPVTYEDPSPLLTPEPLPNTSEPTNSVINNTFQVSINSNRLLFKSTTPISLF